MLFLFPTMESRSLINFLEKIDVIASFIYEWRQVPYCRITRNCQQFVDHFLIVLDISKTWTRMGPVQPIRNFLDSIVSSETYFDNYILNFYGHKKSINNHSDLRDYWNLILPYLKESEDVVIKEFVDLIRGLERGFMADWQKNCDEKKY